MIDEMRENNRAARVARFSYVLLTHFAERRIKNGQIEGFDDNASSRL